MSGKMAGGLVPIGAAYWNVGVVRAPQGQLMERARPSAEGIGHITLPPTAQKTGMVLAVDTTLLLRKNVNIRGEIGISVRNLG